MSMIQQPPDVDALDLNAGSDDETSSGSCSCERCRPSDDRDPPREVGTELAAGYTILGHLARGSALDLYEVWSEERGCQCVAKTARPSQQHSDRARERLLREGRQLQLFTHPHLVRVYETLEAPVAVVILETLPGQTLDCIIDGSRRPMPAASVAFLGLHLCSAVGYMHRHNLLHLDLKPSNVICSYGLAKVIDLSLAAPPGPTSGGRGTRGYLPPEQARGGMLTTAADVWGIGSTLYETATGWRPFAPDDLGHRYPQLKRRAPSVRTRRAHLPHALSSAIDACLEPRPTDRPSVAELTVELNEISATPPPATSAIWFVDKIGLQRLRSGVSATGPADVGRVLLSRGRKACTLAQAVTKVGVVVNAAEAAVRGAWPRQS